MRRTAVPLLRAPPFPWAGTRAAVSDPAVDGGAPFDPTRQDALIAMIRTARVGGTFWAPPIATPGDGTIVLRPRAPDDLAALIDRARGEAPGPILAVLPDTDWARTAAAALPRGGVAAHVGEGDPWSVLAPGTRLLAAPDDEWTLIAAIAGATLIGDAPAPSAEVVASALTGGVRYRDPFRDAPATVEAAIAILAEWRRLLDANRAVATAAGMAWWKRPTIERFLWTGRVQPLRFADEAQAAVDGARAGGGGIACWPSRKPAGLDAAAARAGVPLIDVEDGFIRSIGLGADLHPPLSVVVDHGGIYYDPAGPSDLETLLATTEFMPDLLARAERIARRIVTGGISKYGAAAPGPVPPRRHDRRIVLVAGQVEDDRSVKLGGAGVAGNLDLLARARVAEPDARILFKPHPDVDAGHRRGRVPDAALLAHADAIVRDEPMPALLARVDAVHVLTSLTGFEALLRGLPVTTHGHPFFAGWGLTCDLAGPLPRRVRRLTLLQLVAGTLILYPRYLDPVTGLPCPPEVLLDRFAAGWRPSFSWLVLARRWQGRLARMTGRTTT